jgi:hypothetical protein
MRGHRKEKAPSKILITAHGRYVSAAAIAFAGLTFGLEFLGIASKAR